MAVFSGWAVLVVLTALCMAKRDYAYAMRCTPFLQVLGWTG